jgi:hypothetical protein
MLVVERDASAHTSGNTSQAHTQTLSISDEAARPRTGGRAVWILSWCRMVEVEGGGGVPEWDVGSGAEY